MELLDLPPEIFSAIIHEHVLTVGLASAVKARRTCSPSHPSPSLNTLLTTAETFAAAIYDDICIRHPISSLISLEILQHPRLLLPNLPTLLYNMSPTRCAYTYLLDHMDLTLTFLLSFSPHEFPGQRKRYKRALCTAITAALTPTDIFAYLNQGPYPDSSPLRANMLRADAIGMLAAAAAVDCDPALGFLIEKVPGVAVCSELYGAPLLAAAANGCARSAEFIFLHMAEDDRVAKQLAHTIEMCMAKQYTALVPLLVSWWVNLPLPEKARAKDQQRKFVRRKKMRWLAWGAKNGQLDVVKMCWRKPTRYYRGVCSLTHGSFLAACEGGHVHLVQHFILLAGTDANGRHQCPSDGKGKNACRAFCSLTRGLWVAANNGWEWLAAFLIEAGAEVNGASDEYGSKQGPALYLALRRGHFDTVTMLLRYGANVDESIMMLAGLKEGEIGGVVREAAEKQGRREAIVKLD